MTISLYAAIVPSQIQIIGSVQALLDKMERFCADADTTPDAMLAERLTPDMLPLAYQLKSLVAHSTGAIDGVRKGEFSPDLTPPPTDLASVRAYLAKAIDTLRGIEPDEIDSFVGQPMCFAFGDMRIDFTAEDFLLSFAQPNFYFHATTAYAILRARGVPIGKRDYLGALRIKR